MAYLERLEQQRAMNPEEPIGELENVEELWTPQTQPQEVAEAQQEEATAEKEISGEKPKKKKATKRRKSKKDSDEEEEQGSEPKKSKKAGGARRRRGRCRIDGGHSTHCC